MRASGSGSLFQTLRYIALFPSCLILDFIDFFSPLLITIYYLCFLVQLHQIGSHDSDAWQRFIKMCFHWSNWMTRLQAAERQRDIVSESGYLWRALSITPVVSLTILFYLCSTESVRPCVESFIHIIHNIHWVCRLLNSPIRVRVTILTLH